MVVAVNHFTSDTEAEVATVQRGCAEAQVKAILATHWAAGGAGALDLAREIVRLTEGPGPRLQFTYPDDLPLWDKVRAVAQRIYGASDIAAGRKVRGQFQALEQGGYGRLPVCLAKTQNSFSTDPSLLGRPEGFEVVIRDVRVSAGAGFVVALTGDIMTMPGLPKVPAAEIIDIDPEGNIIGMS